MDEIFTKWRSLLNDRRRKDAIKEHSGGGTAANRLELERDYDRILFSAPVRRLSDKTQVFPLEKNDSVRTRLTHSHEVANLARSVGIQLSFEHAQQVFGGLHDELSVKRTVPSMLAAIGLAHDLGNPPFGHQGELAIQSWFERSVKNNVISFNNHERAFDFTTFDGNRQTFRLITRLQILNDDFGLNLTFATLSASLKYPYLYDTKGRKHKKYGVFDSERSIVQEVWDNVGLEEGVRHPLTFIMEACDDIAYSVMDVEDTVKKGNASFNDIIAHLQKDDENTKGCKLTANVLEFANHKHQEFAKEQISPRELNEVSMQMFRVIAVSKMIEACTTTFVSSIRSLLSREQPIGLIDVSDAKGLCKSLKGFGYNHAYSHHEVRKSELDGYFVIQDVMDMLWPAIESEDEDKRHPYLEFAWSQISENYRRAYKKSKGQAADDPAYPKAQLLCDAVSGMTDSYIVALHAKLKPLYEKYSRERQTRP